MLSPSSRKRWPFLLALFFLAGCFHPYPRSGLHESIECNDIERAGVSCRGIASWYGKDFDGRKTSSGEIYNMYGFSAAHRTLPLGTFLKVTSTDNSKSVVVKVNDRGPFVAGRVLDLSYGAAHALGMVQKGTTEVIYGVVKFPSNNETSVYTLQVGAFSVKENALRFQYKLKHDYQQTVRLVPFESPSGMVYRVRLGLFQDVDQAEKEASLLRKENGIISFLLREDHFP